MSSLRALEQRLRGLGADGGVAHLHTLLGVEQRYVYPHALAAGQQYDPGRFEDLLRPLQARAFDSHPAALALRGRVLRVLDRKAEALAAFDRALSVSPEARTRAWRGELLVHIKDRRDEGLAELEAAGRAAPRDAWPWVWAAAARLTASADSAVFSALETALSVDRGCVPALLLRAEASRRAGELKAGLADLLRVIALEPGCIAAHVLRGDFEADLGRKKRAVAIFAAASRLDPDIKVRYAKLLPGGSLSGLNEHIKKNPKDAWAYALRGDSLRGPGLDGDEPGMADLARAAALDPKTPWIRACLGRSRVQYKYPQEGIADVKTALAGDPKCAWLNSWMGECYRRIKDYDRAVAYYRRAIALDPRFAQVHLWLGRALCERGRWAQGAAEFSRAIELNCAYGFAYAKRGDALARLGRHASALADFDRALNFQVRDDGEWILNRRSRSRMAVGNYAGACEDLARVARKKPRSTWVPLQSSGAAADPLASREALTALEVGAAQYNRAGWLWGWTGAVLLGCGRWEEGMAALERCLALDASFAWAYAWHGRALWQAGRPGAAADFDRALALDVACPWLWSWRAELRLGLGKVKDALQDAERALSVAPMDAHASYCRGEALRRLGRRQEARRSLDTAVEFDPGFAPAFISRGVLLGELGDHQSQLRDFRHAARTAPELFRRTLAGAGLGGGIEAVIRGLLASADSGRPDPESDKGTRT